MERWNAIRFRLLELRVRRADQFALWLAMRIPASWRYWVLIDSVAKFTIEHPQTHPGTITAMELVDFFEPELATFHEHPAKRIGSGR